MLLDLPDKSKQALLPGTREAKGLLYVCMDGCICCMTKFLNVSSSTCALTHCSLYRYTLLIKSLGSLASTSNIIELTHLSIEHIQIESIFNRLQNQQTLLFSLTGTIIRFI